MSSNFTMHKDAGSTTLTELQKYMPLVMVKNGLRAAAGNDSQTLVDRVTKVEFNTIPNPNTLSVVVQLRIWWRLEEDEYHVVGRTEELSENMAFDPLTILEKMTTFQPEDVLRYAAFL